MSWDGFLKGVTCQSCGKELEGQGSGHPAEAYAGTYNGLCSKCTNKGPFENKSFSYLSGVKEWNHPPSCPSWRRDREVYFAFDDCKDCYKGAVRHDRPYGSGGSYKAQCDTCMHRHYAHPATKSMVAYNDARHVEMREYMAQAQAEFEKRLKEAGIAKNEHSTRDEEVRKIAAEVLNDFPQPKMTWA